MIAIHFFLSSRNTNNVDEIVTLATDNSNLTSFKQG